MVNYCFKDNPQVTNATVTDDIPVEPRPSKRRRIAPVRPDFIMYDKRFRDILPQALPSQLPPPPSESPAVLPISVTPPSQRASALDSLSHPARDIDPDFIVTVHNAFGVYRRYHGPEFPNHDPEREIDLTMLSNTSPAVSKVSDFYPYPNETSFRLGDWYWNHGSQKSLENFKSLLDIVGSAEFSPRDIHSTNWSRINRQLALNDWDEGAWFDEDDAGWQKSAISIRIPFHRFLDRPGVRDYVVPDFYHRSLTSVIRERLKKDADNNSHFHFEPFELLWNSNVNSTTAGLGPGTADVGGTAIRLYGELYTSPAFMAAHQDLQNIAGEPNCNLPRVVVGLMFWSDATLLATFGNAKLWPLYMVFGNDSKYQRCKPSSNLYEHVAYFEQVR